MDFAVLLRGIVLGFSIAAPVGPIGLLCIRRTLAHGRLIGFVSGLGGATADAIYGCVAAFGVSVVTNVLLEQAVWLQLAGGVFLCYLGIRTFLAAPSMEVTPTTTTGLLPAYLSVLALTIANPATILSFTAMFAGLGLGNTNSVGDAFALVIGVFVGSLAWWALLSSAVGLFRQQLSPARRRWINRLSGGMLVSFGLLALWGLFRV